MDIRREQLDTWGSKGLHVASLVFIFFRVFRFARLFGPRAEMEKTQRFGQVWIVGGPSCLAADARGFNLPPGKGRSFDLLVSRVRETKRACWFAAADGVGRSCGTVTLTSRLVNSIRVPVNSRVWQRKVAESSQSDPPGPPGGS